MKKLIIFGNSQMAEIADFYFTKFKNLKAEAFFVDEAYVKKEKFNNRPVLALNKKNLIKFSKEEYSFFIAIGSKNLNSLREKKLNSIKELGYKFQNYLSKQSQIFIKNVGENCFVLEHNTIQYGVTLADNCIIWSGNHIGHHTKIEKNVFITSHVVISGNCKVGKNTFLGVNSTLTDKVSIGSYNYIGANTLINKNTNNYEVYKSAKAKKMDIQTNHPKFKY